MTALELHEGVELGYAVVARIADDLGARALAIKGRVVEAQGLRAPRASADADLLVEPTRRDDVVAALVELGWRKVPAAPIPSPFGSHSVTLTHPQWPCELDIHDHFPGFLADPADVFDALWAERTDVTVAGVAVPATGLHGSALVMGLHALRTPNDPRNGRELTGLIERLSPERLDLERLRSLASVTGCLVTARPLLTSLGLQFADSDHERDPRVREWEVRRSTGQIRNLGWLLALRRTPPWRWPALLPGILLSSEPALRRNFPQAPAGARGLWTARWWRLKRGVRDLPAGIRAARLID